MTTKLQIYNTALVEHLGERKLASLTENREPRRILDHFWDDGFVRGVLEQGYWNFATRSVRIDYDPDYTSEFGYTYSFTKPSDYVRTVVVASDEFFKSAITDYTDEREMIFANNSFIYVKYISDDDNFGGDLSRWPETFSGYAAAELALKVSKRLQMSDNDKEILKRVVKELKSDARSKDAMNEEVKFMPQGSWITSRGGGRNNRGGSGANWS